MAGTIPGTTPGMVGTDPTIVTASIAGTTGDGVGTIVRDGILSGIMAGIPALTTVTTTPAIAAISTAMADVVSAPVLQAMPVVQAAPAAVVSARRLVLVVQVHSMVRAAQ